MFATAHLTVNNSHCQCQKGVRRKCPTMPCICRKARGSCVRTRNFQLLPSLGHVIGGAKALKILDHLLAAGRHLGHVAQAIHLWLASADGDRGGQRTPGVPDS